MTTGSTIPSFDSTGHAAAPQALRFMLIAVLLAITALFLLTTLRASTPGYSPVVQSDERPLVLPDR
jgi:hypothetical protein